jgi:hypothetical protein
MLAGVLVRGLIEKEDEKQLVMTRFPFLPITQPLHDVVSALCVFSWARRHICLTLDASLIRSSDMLAASRVPNITIQSEM